jgi:hypothetical protein
VLKATFRKKSFVWGDTAKKIKIEITPSLNGTIIDFETTHWDVKEGELLTAGFLSKDGVAILQRFELSEDMFKRRVIEEIQTKERPWFAFNKEFEEAFLPISIDKELQQYEREAAFGALCDEGLFSHYALLCDPLFNEEIHRFWNLWKSTKDVILLSKIIRHNYCCLAKEYYLKLKRIDKLDVTKINLLPSSAQIEKRYIRNQCGFCVE